MNCCMPTLHEENRPVIITFVFPRLDLRHESQQHDNVFFPAAAAASVGSKYVGPLPPSPAPLMRSGVEGIMGLITIVG